ncbi:MAG: LPS export ABC transporter periplasmic protein LptC [Bacteroidetes bacterium QH_6_63_17]|nr:MAG: LPS export ABC transporter periplasmic protein LptC [Bacteroidetes bacterium QH_6_63_17]
MPQRCSGTHWSVLAAGLIVVVLVGVGCERRARTTRSSSAEADAGPTPTHVSWDAQFVMSEGGRPRAVIAAQRMEQYRTSDSTYSVWRSMHDTARVRLQLYDQQGDSSATVTADSLVFQERKGLLDAYQNVVVVTETDKRLQTEHLIWRQADRKIRTRRFVRIRTPTEVAQGNGLVADENLETYQLGQFEAEVQVDDAESGENE